jgi:predicted adenine nucleotide alpha hydrolase (AANH) superfamily ATPase
MSSVYTHVDLAEGEPLLLHICCAPDEAWVLHSLRDRYACTCFFCNPNISPETEYMHRLSDARDTARRYNAPFFADAYDPDCWEKAVERHVHTPEGGARCDACFLLRLRRTAAFGREHGFKHFTTVMSISPHKRMEKLIEAGDSAAAEYDLIYQPFNFKKENGFLHSIRLSRELGLYRQSYCGCRLSKQESKERTARKHAP